MAEHTEKDDSVTFTKVRNVNFQTQRGI